MELVKIVLDLPEVPARLVGGEDVLGDRHMLHLAVVGDYVVRVVEGDQLLQRLGIEAACGDQVLPDLLGAQTI